MVAVQSIVPGTYLLARPPPTGPGRPCWRGTEATSSSAARFCTEAAQDEIRPADLSVVEATLRDFIQSGQWEEAMLLLQEFDTWDPEDLIEPADLNAVAASLRGFVQDGHWEEAMLLLQESDAWDTEEPYLHNLVLDACSEARHWKGALYTLDDMLWHDVEPDAHSWVGVVEAMQAEEAKRSIHFRSIGAMRERMWLPIYRAWGEGRPPTVDMLSKAIAVSPVDDAVEAMAAMARCGGLDAGHKPDSLAEAFRWDGSWRSGVKLIDEMRARAVQLDGPLYRSLMCKFGAPLPEVALHLFDFAELDGVELDVQAYSAAAVACKDTGQKERMPMVLRAGLQAFRDECDAPGRVPGLETCDAAFRLCETCNDWYNALRLFEYVRARGAEPSAVAFNAMVHTIARDGQGLLALQLLTRMQESTLEPDELTYHVGMLEHASVNRSDLALRLYKECCYKRVRWRMTKYVYNFTGMTPEVAGFALKFALELRAWNQVVPSDPLQIFTSHVSSETVFGMEVGMDSELKLHLYNVLREEFNLKADPMKPGVILVPPHELQGWWRLQAERTSRTVVEKAKKTRKNKIRRGWKVDFELSHKMAWVQPEDDGEDD